MQAKTGVFQQGPVGDLLTDTLRVGLQHLGATSQHADAKARTGGKQTDAGGQFDAGGMGESHHRLPRLFRQAAIFLTDQLLELRPGLIQLHAQPVLSLMANALLGNALMAIDPRGKLPNDGGRPGLR
jgi:hypothetical protein